MSEDFIQLNRETYNKIARPFSATRKFLWDDLLPLKKFVKNGDKVLDVGCGTGRLYHLFKDFQPLEYIGIDQSEGQIEVARELLPGVNFAIGEMTKLSFADNEFDVVFCVATFHHLSDEKSRLKALQEMKRVLKTGGHLLMTNWNLFSEWSSAKAKKNKWTKLVGNNLLVPWKDNQGKNLGDRFYHGFSLEELADLFKQTGFVIVEQHYSPRSWQGEKIIGNGNIVSVVKK